MSFIKTVGYFVERALELWWQGIVRRTGKDVKAVFAFIIAAGSMYAILKYYPAPAGLALCLAFIFVKLHYMWGDK